ncbi:hypothetical protein OROHE_010573 [Orobanche hederae]
MTTPSSNFHFLNYHYYSSFLHSTIMNSTNSSISRDQVAAAGSHFWFFSEIHTMEILAAVAVFVVIHSLRGKRKYGLPNWPFVGMLPSLVAGLRGNMYEWISDVLEGQNGTFTFKGPWFTNLNCVVTADPRNLEYLLKTKFSNFPKGEYFRGTVRDLLGDGIFAADEEKWQRQRKTASLEFHSAGFRRMTTAWKAMQWAGVGSEGRLKESIEGVDDFAREVIRARKKEMEVGGGGERRRSDLLTVFMGMKDEEGKAFSDVFLRDICVNFILVGRDTSSVALSWFFCLLSRNPALEERIVEEICGIVRERGEVEEKEKIVFKAEEVKKMEYLHAALSEALRLYPSVPVDHKEVMVEDDVFPDGTVLKKGTKVVYAIYAMGRMEAIWGKDCRQFKLVATGRPPLHERVRLLLGYQTIIVVNNL